MDNPGLHPNLARLVGSYDLILEKFKLNKISAAEARHQTSLLLARDDQGVQWCINPDDGEWYRITIDNKLVKDTPPTAGIATYTGWDLSNSGAPDDPRSQIIDYAVDPRTLSDPYTLDNSTTRFVRNEAAINTANKNSQVVSSTLKKFIIIAMLILLVLIVGISIT